MQPDEKAHVLPSTHNTKRIAKKKAFRRFNLQVKEPRRSENKIAKSAASIVERASTQQGGTFGRSPH